MNSSNMETLASAAMVAAVAPSTGSAAEAGMRSSGGCCVQVGERQTARVLFAFAVSVWAQQGRDVAPCGFQHGRQWWGACANAARASKELMER
jgi:hypothetical protein